LIEREVATREDSEVRASESDDTIERPGVLTTKQIEAIQTVRRERGYSFKRIAKEWGLSPATVHKYCKDVIPQVTPEPEDEETPPATTAAVPAGSSEGPQPETPATGQSLSDDFIMRFVMSTIQAKISPSQVGPFIDKIRANLQNGGAPNQGPKMPRVSSEATGQRPTIVETNGGENNGQEEPHTTTSLAVNFSDPLERQFAFAALSKGMSTPDFIERIVLPDLKSWGLVKSAVPGTTNEEVETNLLAMIEDCLTFRRMMKKSRSEVQREKQENVEPN
jgi:hypothetical protein